MKTLICSKCSRRQSNGKFCLDCGGAIIEKVSLGASFNPIDSSRSPEQLKKSVRSSLGRIGVQQTDINILQNLDTSVTIEYTLLGKKYSFKSERQNSPKNNLAAVEQFILSRVLGIERGIESAEQAFSAYVALPAPEDVKPSGYDALSKDELKALLFIYHPDTGKEKSTEKFTAVREALARKA